jgi:tRNA(fMet)-specific endonuclease VapC
VGSLIDTSVLIGYERGRIDLPEHVMRRRGEAFFLSVVTASELLHGVHRTGEPKIRERRSAFVEGVLLEFPLLPVDLTTARIHAKLGAELMSNGQVIGSHDLWLAACCIAHGFTMVTGNVREFGRVPGLRIESWS